MTQALSSRLREVVTIERRNLVDNGRGGRKTPAGQPDWLPLMKDVRAEVIALRGDEALDKAVLRSSQLYKVTIRNRPGVSVEHRIRWGAITMEIRVAAPNQRRDELIMTCESGKPG